MVEIVESNSLTTSDFNFMKVETKYRIVEEFDNSFISKFVFALHLPT